MTVLLVGAQPEGGVRWQGAGIGQIGGGEQDRCVRGDRDRLSGQVHDTPKRLPAVEGEGIGG